MAAWTTGGSVPTSRPRDLRQTGPDTEVAALRTVCAELTSALDRDRALFDLAPCGYAVLDPSGCILDANRTLADLTGERQEALHGMALASMVTAADVRLVEHHLAEVLATRTRHHARLRLRRPDRPPLPVIVASQRGVGARLAGGRIWSAMIPAWEGGVSGGDEAPFAGGRDPAHRARLETLGVFASSIAHDFANVVMGIQGCARAARAAVSGEVAALLDDIDSAAEHGGRLVRRLLAHARRQRAERAPLFADGAVARAVELVQRLVGPSVRIELVARAPEALIVGDQVEVDQILMNLATNARDAMPSGGTIRVHTERCELDGPQAARWSLPPGRYVRVAVEDSGVGMDGATRRRLFERYFTTKTPERGTGLGLATVRAIVADLGGAVAVESEPGRGTQVSVLVPIHDD